MSIFLEITQLENGDVVLREAEEEEGDADTAAQATEAVVSRPLSREPLVRIRFSDEVKDMLGDELVGVAEAMIDAATDFLGGDTIELEVEPTPSAPVIH